jgi:hypothetical protein
MMPAAPSFFTMFDKSSDIPGEPPLLSVMPATHIGSERELFLDLPYVYWVELPMQACRASAFYSIEPVKFMSITRTRVESRMNESACASGKQPEFA